MLYFIFQQSSIGGYVAASLFRERESGAKLPWSEESLCERERAFSVPPGVCRGNEERRSEASKKASSLEGGDHDRSIRHS